MTKNSKVVSASGQCLCGKISIALEGEPLRMAQCHCRDCQKSSGTGHMSMVFVTEESVNITGDAAGYAVTTDSGNTYTRNFCATCGSRVYGRNTLRPGVVAIPVGIFDDRSWFQPDAVVYCRNRDDWDLTSHSIPNFDAMPPG